MWPARSRTGASASRRSPASQSAQRTPGARALRGLGVMRMAQPLHDLPWIVLPGACHGESCQARSRTCAPASGALLAAGTSCSRPWRATRRRTSQPRGGCGSPRRRPPCWRRSRAWGRAWPRSAPRWRPARARAPRPALPTSRLWRRRCCAPAAGCAAGRAGGSQCAAPTLPLQLVLLGPPEPVWLRRPAQLCNAPTWGTCLVVKPRRDWGGACCMSTAGRAVVSRPDRRVDHAVLRTCCAGSRLVPQPPTVRQLTASCCALRRSRHVRARACASVGSSGRQ